MVRVRKVPPRLTSDLWNELVNDYVSQSEEGYKQTIPTQLPCNYLIWNDNGTIRARNGLTGKIDFEGVDGSIIIQSVLNSLTSGRTRLEKVVVKGDIKITDTSSLPIKIPSYVYLDLSMCKIIDERAQTYDGKWKNLFENEDRTNGNTHIVINGGILDGKRGTVFYIDEQGIGLTAEGCAFFLEKVYDSIFSRLTIKSFAGCAIGVAYTERNIFEACKAKDCGGYGQFEMTGEKYDWWIQCEAHESASINDVDGFDYCTATKEVWFVNCHATKNYAGLFDANAAADKGRNYIVNFRAAENSYDGIGGLNYGMVIAPFCKNNNGNGLSIGRCNVVLGGQCFDDQATKTQTYGVYIYGQNNIVIGVDAEENADATYDIKLPTNPTGVFVLACRGRVQNKGVITAPTVPPSGGSITNNYGVPMTVYISGGDPIITINGTDIGVSSPCSVRLMPGDTIGLSYSTAPTWVWVGD